MAKMNLNIKMFDMEAGFNPTNYNQLNDDFNQTIPKINEIYESRKEAMQIFKGVAGSPKLSNETRQYVIAMNRYLELTADYFDSVGSWSTDVSNNLGSVTGYGDLTTVNAKLDRTVLDEISESFQNGYIGLENYSDASKLIADIQEVQRLSESAYNNLSSDVQNADSSLPAEVHSKLTQTIDTNNDEINRVSAEVHSYLNEDVEKYTAELQAVIDGAAQGASGQTA